MGQRRGQRVNGVTWSVHRIWSAEANKEDCPQISVHNILFVETHTRFCKTYTTPQIPRPIL